MVKKAEFNLRDRNPDVLTCIANLSNDEVFTPPSFANEMLDRLAEAWAADHKGTSIWSDPSVKFLDPFTKSGVFLREITARLVDGLEDRIPDLEDRTDHILTKQVFGIGITRLTSLMARRSVYCSKWANGKHSVARSFETEDGNIWFEPGAHTWAGGTEWVITADKDGNEVKRPKNGRCTYCGASQVVLGRDDDLETHAYALIHTSDPSSMLSEIFGENVQFDVVIGNPPYQLKDGGHQASPTPIYQKFVESSMSLDPRYLVMVTPSRWFQGGRGLDAFRAEMLKDDRLRVLVDFIRDKDAFPSINVNGGISYFLWNRDNPGLCSVTTVEMGGDVSPPVERALDEFDVFVRRNAALPILRKVLAKGEPSFNHRVSSLKPFGLRTHFHGSDRPSSKANIKFHGSGKVTWVSMGQIESNPEWVQEWKVLVPRATDGNENYPLPIWDQRGPFVAGPGEACSETYLVAAICTSEAEAVNTRDYMRTKFFRFLVSLRKITQDNKADNFSFVPDLTLSKRWTDKALFKRYGITDEEAAFIDTMIRDMEWPDE